MIDFKNIQFIHEEHQVMFFSYIKKLNINEKDFWRISLVYILTSHDDLLNEIENIYDIDKNQLKLNIDKQDEYYGYFSISLKTMFKLALNFYNPSWYKNYDFFNNFDSLDDDFRFVVFQAMLLRY